MRTYEDLPSMRHEDIYAGDLAKAALQYLVHRFKVMELVNPDSTPARPGDIVRCGGDEIALREQKAEFTLVTWELSKGIIAGCIKTAMDSIEPFDVCRPTVSQDEVFGQSRLVGLGGTYLTCSTYHCPSTDTTKVTFQLLTGSTK